MQRALIVAALICVGGVLGAAEARWTIRPKPTTTSATALPMSGAGAAALGATTGAPKTTPNRPVDAPGTDRAHNYHPAVPRDPYVVEQRDSRSSDGTYEYKYVLSNGDTRYERAYWLTVDGKRVLARTGYYSYPMPDGRFLTAFYSADHNGFRQDSLSFSQRQPTLPRSIAVPATEGPVRTTTTRKPMPTTGPWPMGQVNKHANAKIVQEVVVVDVDAAATTTESIEGPETTTRRKQMPSAVVVDADMTTTTTKATTTPGMPQTNSPIATVTTTEADEQQQQEPVEMGM